MKESGSIPLDKIDIVAIIFAFLVFLGSFLNWGGNRLSSVTGIQSGAGYVTILIALIVVGLSYYDRNNSERMFGIFLLGVGVVTVGILFLNRIFQAEVAGTGGGLLLILIAGLGIAFTGLWGYTEYTSTKRTATVIFAIIFGVAILTSYSSYVEQQERQERIERVNQEFSTLHFSGAETFTDDFMVSSNPKIEADINVENFAKGADYIKARINLTVNGKQKEVMISETYPRRRDNPEEWKIRTGYVLQRSNLERSVEQNLDIQYGNRKRCEKVDEKKFVCKTEYYTMNITLVPDYERYRA